MRLCFCLAALCAASFAGPLSSWVVHTQDAAAAKKLASDVGLVYLGPVGSLENHFRLDRFNESVYNRVRRHVEEDMRFVINVTAAIMAAANARAVYPQVCQMRLVPLCFALSYFKHEIIRTRRSLPSDPMFEQQWYMQPNKALSLHVFEAWEQGYTGR